MKNSKSIFLVAITFIILAGIYYFKGKEPVVIVPEDKYVMPEPDSPPTPAELNSLFNVKGCFNDDGIEVECKG